MGTDLPVDWYRTSFAPNYHSLYWEQGGEEKADLAVEILDPHEGARILELACASGRRTLQFARHGFNVIGTDIHQGLLEPAGCEAETEDLILYLVEVDPREIGFEREFHYVVSLGGGAFGHFESDAEDMRAFAAAARALHPGGRLLMQIPNAAHVEAHLPRKTWLEYPEAVDVIEQAWNEDTRRIDGIRRSLIGCETVESAEPVPFHRRIYSIEELEGIFESQGMSLIGVYDERGAPCEPTDAEQEIFVIGRYEG